MKWSTVLLLAAALLLAAFVLYQHRKLDSASQPKARLLVAAVLR
jgi:outer membrane biosynthesis protein TonB